MGTERIIKNFRNTITIIGVLLACAAILASCGSATTVAYKSHPLVIGAVFSITGGGDVYGPQQVRGAELAVAQINAEGGINGAPIHLQIINDGSSPTGGRLAMTNLIDRYHAVAIMGPTLSDVAVKADPIADSLHTPVLAVSNTAPGIVGKCAYPCTWIWRDSLGESVAVPDAISYALSVKHQSSAVTIHPNGDLLGTAEAQIADSAFRADGIPVTANIVIPDRASEISSLVAKAVSADPGIIFIGASYGNVAAAVVHDLVKQGFTGQIIGGNTFNSQSTLSLIGDTGAGALSGAAWWAGNDFPANSTFESAYNRAFGIAPDQFAAQAYTGILILAQAMRHAGLGGDTKYSPVEQRSMIQHALSTVALITPLGPFRFTKSHDVSQIAWVLKISPSGTHQLADFCNPGC